MPFIIDYFGELANIFRSGPPSIFEGRLVEANLILVGADRPLKIFVVSAPEKYRFINPFFWALGKIKEIDNAAGRPRVLQGSNRDVAEEYQKIYAACNPRPII